VEDPADVERRYRGPGGGRGLKDERGLGVGGHGGKSEVVTGLCSTIRETDFLNFFLLRRNSWKPGVDFVIGIFGRITICRMPKLPNDILSTAILHTYIHTYVPTYVHVPTS
jgi:hypothetical protein